jgi:HlyD family secretion protein
VQNVVTYVVIIDVDNLDLKLKPGMTANVSIIITQKKDALLIPNAALRFKPAEANNKKGHGKKPRSSEKPEKKGPSVWVLDKEKPAKVFVETGISDGTHTEIVSGGLKESADVIVEDATESKKKAKEAGPRMFH